jgi:hypothetical protein
MRKQYIARLAQEIREMRNRKTREVDIGWVMGFLAGGLYSGHLNDIQYFRIGQLITQIHYSI